MPKKVLFLVICFALIGIFKAFAQEGSQPEEISITTYYPSPYGSYNELQTNKMAIGDTNGDGKLDFNDGSANNGELLVAGNVGIGGQIKITGGSPAANKVLTSDASGLASWQIPSSALGSTGLYGWCARSYSSMGSCPYSASVLDPMYVTGTADCSPPPNARSNFPTLDCSCPAGYTRVLTGTIPRPPGGGVEILYYSCYKN